MQAPVASDSLRAVLDTVFAAPGYDWVEPTAPLVWARRLWRWLIESLAGFREENPAVFRVFVLLLILLLGLIVLHAGWVLFRTARAAEEQAAAGRGQPQPAAWTASRYRAEAESLAAAGRYREALGAAFHALVLELDDRGVLRYHPSKTPREYLGDRSLSSDDRPRLAALVQGLYRYRFGQRDCGPEEYRAWLDEASTRWHVAPS